jgi:hypothetical protein
MNANFKNSRIVSVILLGLLPVASPMLWGGHVTLEGVVADQGDKNLAGVQVSDDEAGPPGGATTPGQVVNQAALRPDSACSLMVSILGNSRRIAEKGLLRRLAG